MTTKDNSLLTSISGLTVAVIGYGSQGRAHALNLRDNGINVLIGQRHSSSFDAAVKDGFNPLSVSEAVSASNIIAVLLNDEAMAGIYSPEIKPFLQENASLCFAHGFNLHFHCVKPAKNHDCFIVSPKGPGYALRESFLKGIGLPCLIAIHKNASGSALSLAKAYAEGIGCNMNAVFDTTIEEETITDLFGEQTVLCGGVIDIALAGFETLVEAGYNPDIAYFECIHEIKLIIDLLYQGGLSKIYDSISNTAQYGGLTRGPKLIDENIREKMRQILKQIQSGEFAKEWIEENRTGGAAFKKLTHQKITLPAEAAGKRIRRKIESVRKP